MTYLKRSLFLGLCLFQQSAIAQLYLDLVPYREGKLHGYCTTAGDIRIKPQYDEVNLYTPRYDSLYNPALQVRKGDQTLMIDPQGNTVVPAGFTNIQEHYHRGFVFYEVTNAKGQHGLFANGKAIVPVQFSNIQWAANEADARSIQITAMAGAKKENFAHTFQPPVGVRPGRLSILYMANPAETYFGPDEMGTIKFRNMLDSIRYIDRGIAYVETDHKPGLYIIDKLRMLKGNYTLISIDLLDKFRGTCVERPAGKVLLTVQQGDKYLLLDEQEKNYFGDQQFTDTEGNSEYVVVKDGTRIGFFTKDQCFKTIPTKYGRFVDAVRIELGNLHPFLVYKVIMAGQEVLVGQNGVEYFKDLK